MHTNLDDETLATLQGKCVYLKGPNGESNWIGLVLQVPQATGGDVLVVFISRKYEGTRVTRGLSVGAFPFARDFFNGRAPRAP